MERCAIRMSWSRWPAFIVIALVGLAIRLPQLDVRPMHTDEAVNAYIVGQLLAGEPFTYDPQDRHGPALAALALPLAWMHGARSFSDLTESELRLTSVVAGTIMILLFGAATEMCPAFSPRSCLQSLRCPSTTTGTLSMNPFSARPHSDSSCRVGVPAKHAP